MQATPLALKRRRLTREFKLHVVRKVEAGRTAARAAREDQMHCTLPSCWMPYSHLIGWQPRVSRPFLGQEHLMPCLNQEGQRNGSADSASLYTNCPFRQHRWG